MIAQDLLTQLRRAGIVLTVHGKHLAYDGPSEALTPEIDARLRKNKDALIALVAAGWWPEGRPRPSVFGLAKTHGAQRVNSMLLAVGCDIAHRDPTWEELFVAAEVLGQSATSHSSGNTPLVTEERAHE